MKKYTVLILLTSLNLYSQSKGIEIYALKSVINSDKSCDRCFDISKEILSDKPIFATEDIDHFDWNEQQFVLTSSGQKKLNMLKIPNEGLPVVFVINGNPIYGFWFWTWESSFGCDRVYTYPKHDFKLVFGLPSGNTYGTDPRYDMRIKKYLDTKK